MPKLAPVFGVILAVSVVSTALGKDKKEDSPVEVFTFQLQEREIFDPVVFGGFLRSEDQRGVGPEIQGTVDKVYVNVGDRVGKGQPLFRVRPQGAGQDFRPNVVRSPIAGIVTQIFHEAGAFLNSGEPAVEVADPRSREVSIHVTYDDLDDIGLNQDLFVNLATNTAAEVRIRGKVTSKAPAADAKLGTFPIKIKLDCESEEKLCQDKFLIGAFVRAEFRRNVRRGVMVPVKHLVSQRKQAIQLLADNTVKFIQVELGDYYGKEVEVLKGLKPGMTIVSNFSKYPKEGVKVVVKDESEEKSKLFSGGKEKGKKQG